MTIRMTEKTAVWNGYDVAMLYGRIAYQYGKCILFLSHADVLFSLPIVSF